MKNHITKDGKEIPIGQLNDRHLENIIKKFEKQAEEGYTPPSEHRCEPEFIGMDETLYGKEALWALGYQDYVDELNSRKASQG